MPLIQCSVCYREVSDKAENCPGCGHPVAGKAGVQAWSPGVAAVLSLVLPGAGHMYKGQVTNGLVWLLVVTVGYVALILPGLILHVCCVISAAREEASP